MRSVIAIAGIALRAAVRSRMVLTLLLALATVVPAIAFTARGDGTAMGQVQVLLTYSLGLAWVLLSMATLWAGCAAISAEIRGKQAQVLLSLPVHRWQVWLGKWLGLTVLNALLLAASGLAVWALLHHRLRGGEWPEAERRALERDVLHCHRVLVPEAPDVEPAARALLKAEMENSPLAPAQAEVRLRELRRQELTRRRGAAPGETVEWTFDLPAPLAADGGLRLQYQFTSSSPGQAELKGAWWVGTPEKPETARGDVLETGGAQRVIDLPADRLAGARRVVLRFLNLDPGGAKVFFDPDNGVRLLRPEGAFAGNLCRALLALLGQLAFLTALGVSAGALFSFPVASVVAVFALLLQQMGGFIGDVVGGNRFWEPQDPGPWTTVLLGLVHGVFGLLDAVVAPLRFENPLEMLSLGHRVTLPYLGSVWFSHVCGYGLLAAAVGILLFQRREVALPE